MSWNPNDRYATGAYAQAPATAIEQATIDEGLRSYMLRVYNYMASGLLLTGVIALAIANSDLAALFFTRVMTPRGAAAVPTLLGWGAILSPLAFVLVMSFGINRLSAGAAQALFWLFCAAMGVSMVNVFLTFTGISIARVFFITAGTFGAMSLWGYATKRDLTGMGSFLMMGLFGIVIAGLVNLFLQSSALYFATSLIGVVVFVGLTAYDTQRIKNDYIEHLQYEGMEVASKRSVFDALALYLNFINLFQLLLSFLGQRQSE